AAEILLTGRLFSGVEIAELGVASRALPAAEALPRAIDIARDIAADTAPESVAASKRILWLDPPPSGAEIDRLEREVHLRLMGRPDAREGVLAFLRKRAPRWELTAPADSPDDLC